MFMMRTKYIKKKYKPKYPIRWLMDKKNIDYQKYNIWYVVTYIFLYYMRTFLNIF